MLLTNWVLIQNWSGLEIKHPVKITRAKTLQSLEREFGVHVSCCPPFMDNVLYNIKQQKVSHNCANFIKSIIFELLDHPEVYSTTTRVIGSFEDYCIKEYCSHMANVFFDELRSSSGEMSQIKALAMNKWEAIQEKRRVNEAYLKATFPEDLLRSSSEMNKILESTNWRLLL